MQKLDIDTGAFRPEAITFTGKMAIIGISTHGVIIHDRPIIAVPDEIDLAKMNFVMPSVCSFLVDEDVQRCNDTIMREVNKTPGLERQDVYDLCRSLTEKIKPILLSSVGDIGSYLKSATVEEIIESENVTKTEAEADLDRRQAFRYGIDRGIRIFSTTRGITHMINKSYIRDTSKDLANPYGDWQIKLLNHPDQPDLIPDIYKSLGKYYTRSEAEITLEEILTFLISKGINKIIIFDYSCSNITDEDRNDIARNERDRRRIANIAGKMLRLSDDTLGYGGKRKGGYRFSFKPPFSKKKTKKQGRKTTKRRG